MNNELIQSSEFFEAIKPYIVEFGYNNTTQRAWLRVNVTKFQLDIDRIKAYLEDEVALSFSRYNGVEYNELSGYIRDTQVSQYLRKSMFTISFNNACFE